MDVLARDVFYAAMFLDAICLGWLSFSKKKSDGKAEQWFFWLILAVHCASVVMYALARNGLPLDMRTQDALIKTCGLSVVFVYVWAKYRDRLLARAILLAQLLFFASAFPMPLPSQLRLCAKLSAGVALPLSVVIYDLSVVVFAYCGSLSLTWFFRNRGLPTGHPAHSDAPSLYERIGNCALWGLAIFTLSQVLGSFGNLVQHGTYWDWNPFHLLFVAVWLFYAAMVHVKWVGGMSRRALPVLGITGFLAILGFKVLFLVR